MTTKTFHAREQDLSRHWLLYDAAGATLGRLASTIAYRLRGKHKAIYSPHLDAGDFIIVVNADQVRVSGNKEHDKMYYRHSGYPGGLRAFTLRQMRAKHAERIIYLAVRGMLPKGPLGRRMLGKLKVYAGASHPHTAQQPQLQNHQE